MGQIIGRVITEWCKNEGSDRLMRLMEDFTFIDSKGINWTAKAGSIIDGASIPRILWSSVGPPLSGDYRRASVIHDVYCKSQDRDHRAVHKMFHELMLADGVGPIKAQSMYFAVKTFGPKWSIVEETISEIL